MKTRRKTDSCLNCETPLRPEDNYCPRCGQENNSLNIPIGRLLYETLEIFVNIDAKLWNTLKATFTHPGKISKEFLEGKRARFVPPVKFYFFVSFIFFLLVGWQSDNEVEKIYANHRKAWVTKNTESVSLYELLGKSKPHGTKTDSTRILRIDLEFTDTTDFKNILAKLPAAANSVLDSLLLEQNIDTTANNRNNLRSMLQQIPTHSATIDSIKNDSSITIYNNYRFPTKEAYNKFKEDLPLLTNHQLDSIATARGEKPGWFNRQLIRKVGRFNSDDPDNVKQIIHAIIQSVSLTMFVMMPLTALLLLLIFYRKKYYYEHLIFSIHTHTVFFLVFSIVLLIQQFIDQSFGEKCWKWALLLCLVYLILSLKRMYTQTWWRTIYKFMLMFIPYFLVSLTLTLLAAIYGFLA